MTATDRTRDHRVVIVGGGFGGLNAARELGRSPARWPRPRGRPSCAP